MKKIEKTTAEQLIGQADETQDGMFTLVSQAAYAIDMCVHRGSAENENGFKYDFSVYQIDIYNRKPEFVQDNDIMNFSYMTKFKESFFDEFVLTETHYFDCAAAAHLAFASTAAKLNHF